MNKALSLRTQLREQTWSTLPKCSQENCATLLSEYRCERYSVQVLRVYEQVHEVQEHVQVTYTVLAADSAYCIKICRCYSYWFAQKKQKKTTKKLQRQRRTSIRAPSKKSERRTEMQVAKGKTERTAGQTPRGIHRSQKNRFKINETKSKLNLRMPQKQVRFVSVKAERRLPSIT